MNTFTRRDAEQRDRDDPLAPLRARFELPPGVIYLDGNSLGALPRGVAEHVQTCITQEWGEGLIRSWNDAGWYALAGEVGARLAPLIGAEADEVIVSDNTSVNLFKVLSAALRMRADRSHLLLEAGDFPTSHYIAASAAGQAGQTVQVCEASILADRIDESVSVVSLTQVNYRTGYRHDLAEITRRAHAAGALVVWDLCHSAGAMPCDLNAHQVDFAVGCGYKFLNGGPGAPAFLYVARRHVHEARHPLTGWFGHARPFAFEPDFEPVADIRRMLTGTPGILGLRALQAALEVFEGVSLQALRDRSVALTEFMMQLIDQQVQGLGLKVLTPRAPEQRGSQVSVTHPEAYAVMQALIERGVIGDVRAPDILRFGLAPMYSTFTEIWDAMAHLKDILERGVYREARFSLRKTVT